MQNDARITLFQARLIYDPKVTTFANGSTTKLVVAVKTKRKKDPNSTGYDEKYPYDDDIYVVEVRGAYGESIAKLVKKNSLVDVEGEFAINIWKDREGNEHRDMRVEANMVKVLFQNQSGYTKRQYTKSSQNNTQYNNDDDDPF